MWTNRTILWWDSLGVGHLKVKPSCFVEREPKPTVMKGPVHPLPSVWGAARYRTRYPGFETTFDNVSHVGPSSLDFPPMNV